MLASEKMATKQLQDLLDSFETRLRTIEGKVLPEGASAPRSMPAAEAPADVPEFVGAFDEYCTKCLDPFVAACEKLGGGAAAGVREMPSRGRVVPPGARRFASDSIRSC